ncbi:Gfo/Idh/MocA family protein [Sunxiuqinia indica]|uniref:Gfo/Idh/MocA family protein n=1 Tax=Sunxiuqinia indica TaxID=2692584 RepID=UPI00135AF2D3|nr:Gfo/Idh/MocA family oxidoreductase [Sunxiuqinia indica]
MTTRRSFIKSTTTATAAVGLAASMPAAMTACAPKIVRCGLIGAKGMGFADLKAFLGQPDTECVAICDVDQRVLDARISDTEKLQGKKPKSYNDYRQLIADPEVDAVIIGTPDHWHCLPFVEACKAGKAVYCEKPLGNTIEEINIMEAAANKYNTVVQIGQWQRSDSHWRDAVDFVKSGKLGKIRTVRTWSYQGWMGSIPVKPDREAPEGVDYDFWLGPAKERPFNPNRFHFDFRWFWDYAGGLMTDWGVHIIDYGLFGMQVKAPKSVMAMGGKFAYPEDAAETPDTLQAIYEFDDFTMLWDHGIGIDGGYYGRTHGVGFVGNNGTLVVDRKGWEVIPERKNDQDLMERVELQKGTGKGLEHHMENFLDGVRDNRRDLNCSIDIAANTARVAHLGNIALKTGRRLYWDSEQSRFIGDDEANKHLVPSYRSPWELPTV